MKIVIATIIALAFLILPSLFVSSCDVSAVEQYGEVLCCCETWDGGICCTWVWDCGIYIPGCWCQ